MRKRTKTHLAEDFTIDITRRSILLSLKTGEHHEVNLCEISARLRAVPADALLDSYLIGGGTGVRWPGVEELSVTRIVKFSKTKLSGVG